MNRMGEADLCRKILEEVKVRRAAAIRGSIPGDRDCCVLHLQHRACPLVLVSSPIVGEPHGMKPSVRSQIVDVPVRSCGQLLMVGDPGTQATRPQRAPQVNVIPALKLHRSQAPDLNTGIARQERINAYVPGFGLMTIPINVLF